MRSPIALLLLALGLLGGLTWVLLDSAEPTDPGAGLSAPEQGGNPTEGLLVESASAAAPEESAGERSEVESDGPLLPAEQFAARLRGRVVRTIGGPVVGARVELRVQQQRGRRRDGAERPQQEGEAPSVSTGARGEFTFAQDLARGARFSLVVTHRDHASSVVSHRLPRGDEVPEGLTLHEGSIDVGEVKLTVGATVRGRVVTPDGYALPQAEVQLVAGGRWRGPRRGVTRSLFQPVPVDANGMFVMRHVNAGSYRFQASASEWQRKQTEESSLAEGSEVDLGNIELRPGCLVSGIVVSTSDGQPVARANVSLATRGGGRRGRSERARTDKEGRFTIDHLPLGTADLTINAQGFLNYEQKDLELQRATNLTFRVSPGLVLRGVVVDANTGQPVPRFSVAAERIGDLPDPQRDAARSKLVSDATGVFAAVRGNSSGSAGGPSREKIGELMARFREVRSSVSTIRGSRFRGRSRPEKVRDPKGRFELSGLQPGRYVVRVTSEKYVEQISDPIDLRLGVAAPEHRVAIASGVGVSGRVVDAEGQPIRGVRLQLSVRRPSTNAPAAANPMSRWMGMLGSQREARPGQLSARSRKDGTFAFAHVAAGEYRLSANAKGWSDGGIPELKITAARDDLSLTLGALASIHGAVQGVLEGEAKQVTVVVAKVEQTGGAAATGERARGGRRSFGRSFGGIGNTKTAKLDAAGNYRIEDLEPGSYVVRAVFGSLRTYLQARAGAGLANLTADVQLAAGSDVERSVVIDRVPTGTVTGTARHNGALAAGARISLRPVSTDNSNGSGVAGLLAMRSRMGGSSATVDGAGRFELKNVLPGAYTLEVRKGRRSRTVIHQRPLQVGVGSMIVQIAVQTGGLSGTVALPADVGDATIESFRPRAFLLRGVTSLPTGDAVRSAFRNSGGTAKVGKDGVFAFNEVATGTYFLVVTGRGRETVGRPVTITGPSARPVDFTLGAKRPEGTPAAPSGRRGAPSVGGPRRGGRGAGERGAGGRGR